MEDAIIYISIAVVFFVLGASAMYCARSNSEQYYEELYEEYSAFMTKVEKMPKGSVVPVTPRQLHAINYFSGEFLNSNKYIVK